jgi:glycosyltransferase involved in cell wall biosynthesis
LIKAIKRLVRFTFSLSIEKKHAVLIFTADGFSFFEKGLMAIIAKTFTNATVVIAPRSGLIVEDINRNGFLSRFITKVFNKVDFVLCQSNHWKKYFEKTVSNSNSNKFIVIENCIDISKYNSLTNDLTIHPKEILFLSWVDKNKGIYELLEASKLLKDEKINFKLTIAGNGNAFDEIKSMIKNYNLEDNIDLFGWALGADKIKLLQKCNIYVLPSYYEGYPNSLLEAMASSKACIATNVGSISDIIENGTNGYLINPRNHIELYEKLKELISDNEKIIYFSNKARETILNNNTSEIYQNKIKNILNL